MPEPSEGGVAWISTAIDGLVPDGLFKALLLDGIIAGVGSVIVFLPNIIILFFCIALFEDTGYMARAAFIMDRVMHLIGLHGKSFIPMLMGFGCNVPAIMATRTLESERDRILTILINPLMSCSARFPVYVLLAGTWGRLRVLAEKSPPLDLEPGVAGWRFGAALERPERRDQAGRDPGSAPAGQNRWQLPLQRHHGRYSQLRSSPC